MDSSLLPRVTPGAVGVDPRGVTALLDGWERRHIELHSLLLLRHGRVFAEAHWTPYAPTDAPLLYSLSKTFCSAVVGLVVSDGAFGYDDRLVDLFADVVEEAGPVASRIRVRDCLAMATGHTTDIVPTVGFASAPGRAPWRTLLATEPDGEPGHTFCYNQFATWTLAEIVRHATGRTVLEHLRERVLGPLGITHASWDTDQRGRVLGFTGLHLRPEAVAAFFQLLLDEGVHHGERLLPVEWITRYRRKQVETLGDRVKPDWEQGYGWQVWLDMHGGHRGDGAFGQFGLLLPQHDAALVATASTQQMQGLLEEVWASLLPAFDRPQEPHGDAGPGLSERLAGASLRTVGGSRGGPVNLSFENRTNRWQLRETETGWQLRWVDDLGGDHRLAVGFDQWDRSTMRWGTRSIAVAASGAWVGWGHWVGHLRVLDAPHSLLVHLRDDGSGRLEWVEGEPLGGRGLIGLAQAPEGQR